MKLALSRTYTRCIGSFYKGVVRLAVRDGTIDHVSLGYQAVKEGHVKVLQDMTPSCPSIYRDVVGFCESRGEHDLVNKIHSLYWNPKGDQEREYTPGSF